MGLGEMGLGEMGQNHLGEDRGSRRGSGMVSFERALLSSYIYIFILPRGQKKNNWVKAKKQAP